MKKLFAIIALAVLLLAGKADAAPYSAAVTAYPATPEVMRMFENNSMYGGNYKEFIADTGEAQTAILLATARPVEDLKVLDISFDSVDDKGKATFTAQPMFDFGPMAPGYGLVLKLVFAGSIPNRGISYVDSGKVRAYSIAISGEDGSIVLDEIKLKK